MSIQAKFKDEVFRLVCNYYFFAYLHNTYVNNEQCLREVHPVIYSDWFIHTRIAVRDALILSVSRLSDYRKSEKGEERLCLEYIINQLQSVELKSQLSSLRKNEGEFFQSIRHIRDNSIAHRSSDDDGYYVLKAGLEKFIDFVLLVLQEYGEGIDVDACDRRMYDLVSKFTKGLNDDFYLCDKL